MIEPTADATLERTRRLCSQALWTVALQVRRLRTSEPEDEEFLLRRDADFQFLIITLRRLRRAASIAGRVQSVADEVAKALSEFDSRIPSLDTMRNIGEHIDAYAVDDPQRHDMTVDRRMLEVSSWDGYEYRWLGGVLVIADAQTAAQDLFSQICLIQQAHPRPRRAPS